MFSTMQAGRNFKPADFGIVLLAGRGNPPPHVRAMTKALYDMIDIPTLPATGWPP